MRRLFEGFEILCTDYDHILEKRWIIFKGGHYINIKQDIIQGNTEISHMALIKETASNNHNSFWLVK